MNIKTFIKMYLKEFGKNEEYQIKFEMSNPKLGKKRIQQVMFRFESIANFIFQRECWVVLIIWGARTNNMKDFLNYGFKEEDADNIYLGKLEDKFFENSFFDNEALEDSKIMYIRYNKYEFKKIAVLIKAIASLELAIPDTPGINAYFVKISDTPVLLNLYDDRGMEVLSNNKDFLDTVANKYKRYLFFKNF